jgi:hypothetical protein
LIHSLRLRRLGLIALALAVACHRKEKPPSDVLAQVGEVTITKEDFNSFFAFQTKGTVLVRGAPLELKQMVLRKLIVLELFVREGRRVGFEKRHQYSADRPSGYEMKEWLANGLLQETIFPPVPESTEEERRSYYDAHHEEFTIPERIRASVIVVGDEASAARLRTDERVLQDARSEDFVALVNASCTDDAIRSHGGDLGWVLKSHNRGWQPQDLVEAAGRLKNIGDISQPIKTEHGWAIIKLTNQHAAELLAYEAVKDDVGNSVRIVKLNRQTEDFIEMLRSQVIVLVYEDRL